MAAADHQHLATGIAPALGAEDVGDAVPYASGGPAFADRRNAAGARRVGAAPRAGGVDHRTGQQALLPVLGASGRDLERLQFACPGRDAVHGATRDRHDVMPEAQGRGDPRMGSQRRKVILDELAAGGVAVGVVDPPARRLEKLARGGVYVEAPGREERHMSPFADRGSRAVTGLEQDEGQIPDRELRGGGQSDRPRPDDGDRQSAMCRSGIHSHPPECFATPAARRGRGLALPASLAAVEPAAAPQPSAAKPRQQFSCRYSSSPSTQPKSAA